MVGYAFKYPISFQCLSSSFLKAFVDLAPITYFGSLFHWFMTLSEKKSALHFSDFSSLGLNSFNLCPLVSVSASWKKRLACVLSKPFRILNVSIRSPRSLLCSRLYKLSTYSRSWNVRCLVAGTSLVALLWIFSNKWMSFFRPGFHAWTQYSRWGLMYVLYRIVKLSMVMYLNVRFTNYFTWILTVMLQNLLLNI